MPDVSIAITAQDRYSSAIKSMSQVTKSFSKDADEMEEILHKLNTNKYSLKLDADAAMRELKEMEKQFAATGDEADGLKAQLARANYDNIKRNLDLVTKGAKDAERQMQKTGEAFRKADNQAAGSGFQSIIGAVATSGALNMLGNVSLNATNTLVGSALGEETGTVVSSVLSSAIAGAAMGSIIPGIGTALGAAIGGAAGLISGGTQVYEKRDDAFKSYYADLYDQRVQEKERALSAGTGIAAGRETDLISFSTLFGDKETAQNYLDDLTTMANTTPFLYGDLTAMSKTLATYGYGADSILPVLGTIGDAGAALGMQTSDMQMVATAIGRMKTTDKASLEYLNLLQERGIGAVGMLSESYGVSQQKMYDLISDGEISGKKAAEIILAALTDSFQGSMAKQSQTFSGLSSTVEGLQQEIDNAMGEAYNLERTRGLRDDIEAYGGTLGAVMENINGIVGENKAYLENLQGQFQREALAAVLLGEDTTVFSEEDSGKLKAKREEFISASARYEETGSRDAALDMERLRDEAQALAAAAYESSDQYQKAVDAQLDSITAIRDNTAGLEAATNAYRMQAEKSKGEAAVGVKDVVDGVNAMQYNSIDPYTGRPYSEVASWYSSNAYGLDYVPYDNFPALLHEGERVLTASQARAADHTGGQPVQVTITGNHFYGSDQEMEERMARKVASEVSRALMLAN